MSQNLPVNDFEWVEKISKFDEGFMKSHNEEGGEGYFLKIDVQYSEKLHDIHNDLPFLPEKIKIKSV